MASSEADLARLTQSQQLALQTYISVTNQDPAASIPLLERSEWNVQVRTGNYPDQICRRGLSAYALSDCYSEIF